jgi:3-deoxy-7-phosphoheptulonate synthase
VLRGGAFKPRSSPYSFQGLGLEGLKILAKARRLTGLAIVTEAIAETDVDLIAEYADIIQVGSRNMENSSLLEAVSRCGRPVLLKRGLTARLEDLLTSAELLLASGNPNVILCERGIRTFETATRNTLDISAVPVLHAVTHLPVIVDPSHAAGACQSGGRRGRRRDHRRGPSLAPTRVERWRAVPYLSHVPFDDV